MPGFCNAIETFDSARIEGGLNDILSNAASLRDTAPKVRKENYYLATMNTALLARADWKRSSNQESGDGFADVMVENDGRNRGTVFEEDHPPLIDMQCLQTDKSPFSQALCMLLKKH